MTGDLVSLTMIMLVAAFCPIVTQMIPGKVVPQTVLLLLAGALMGPHMGQVIDVDQSIELLSELGLAFLFCWLATRSIRKSLPAIRQGWARHMAGNDRAGGSDRHAGAIFQRPRHERRGCESSF